MEPAIPVAVWRHPAGDTGQRRLGLGDSDWQQRHDQLIVGVLAALAEILNPFPAALGREQPLAARKPGVMLRRLRPQVHKQLQPTRSRYRLQHPPEVLGERRCRPLNEVDALRRSQGEDSFKLLGPEHATSNPARSPSRPACSTPRTCNAARTASR